MKLASIEDIEAATLKHARGIIGHDAMEGRIKLTYRIEVHDASGATVHCLPFEDAVKVERGANA